jgi:hypothetical protein
MAGIRKLNDDSKCNNPMHCMWRWLAYETDLMCPHCDNKVVTPIKGGDMTYVNGIVEQKIWRRIRRNEWARNELSGASS